MIDYLDDEIYTMDDDDELMETAKNLQIVFNGI